MRHFLGFSRIARDSKINAREGAKMRHFRAKSHLDTLHISAFLHYPQRQKIFEGVCLHILWVNLHV